MNLENPPETCNIVKLHRNSHIFWDLDDDLILQNFFYWPEFSRFDKKERQNIYKLTPISYVDPENMPEMEFFLSYKTVYLTESKLVNHFEVAISKKNLNNHPLTDVFI